jgi:YVTN family beta-propeller protein
MNPTGTIRRLARLERAVVVDRDGSVRPDGAPDLDRGPLVLLARAAGPSVVGRQSRAYAGVGGDSMPGPRIRVISVNSSCSCAQRLPPGLARSARRNWQRAIVVASALLLPLALATAVAAPAWASSGYTVTATIPVGSGPAGVAVDPDTGTVYVANHLDGTVSVISEATDAVTNTISVGGDLGGVAVDHGTGTVYVTASPGNSGNSNEVVVISEATDTVTTTIGVGLLPSGVAVDPDTGTVYVANRNAGTVSVISDATDTVTATINVGGNPILAAVDPGTGTVYVGNGNGTVSVISEATDTVTDTITVNSGPTATAIGGVAVDPDTGTVYVANAAQGSVSAISEATDTVTVTIPVGTEPEGLAIDQASGTVYVANARDNTVSVIGEATGAVVTTVTVGSEPLGVAADPDTSNVFVTNTSDNTVSVISPATITVNVDGSQVYGSSTSVFAQTNDAPAGVTISGTVSCGTVNGGEPINGNLAAGSYTIDGSSCSGLTAPAGYALAYDGGSFTVTQAAQSISFTAPGTGTVGGSATLTATGGSGNPVVFTVDPSSGSGVCNVSGTNGSTVNYTAAGSCVIDANQTGNANYTAAPPVTQTITVGQAAQSISFTAPGTGTVGGSATLTATGGGSGNPVVFTVDPSSGSGCNVSGTNGSTVNYTAAGSCVIDANQAGNANYTAAPPVTATITVNQAPAFVLDSPPLTAVAGQAYDYTFEASGTPAPTYALAPGAPSWLSVNTATGEVTGAPPAGTSSFSYAVTATNVAGAATAGPFTVTVAKASSNADISAVLSCPADMTVGGTGTCTLTVANAGPAAASKVVAGVALPAALSEVSCTSSCARHANVFTWTLASLASGASAKFTITVKASRTGTATVLAAAASQSPDPHPLNNVSIQQISIKH